MKEVQRRATENRLKILSQHSEVIKWCQNKLKKQQQIPLEQSEQQNQSAQPKLNTSLILNNENEIVDGFANSTSAIIVAEDDEQQNQLDESTINQSLIESKIMKQVKQHLNSEK
jgi:hypothetical protein